MSERRPGESVGFVGLGHIGLPMATSLLRTVEAQVFDLRPEAVAAAVAAGATAAPDLAALAASSTIVCVVVLDEHQVETVVRAMQPDLAPGTVVLLHSTVSPMLVRRLAAELAEGDVELVDAPVTGGSTGAARGDLTIMVGGDPAVLERTRFVLEGMAERIVPMGPLGAGSVAKLINNVIRLGTGIAMFEALRLARGFGLDEAEVLDVVMTGTGDSYAVRTWRLGDRQILEHTAGEDFPEVPSKDLWLAASAAREVGVHLPAVALLAEIAPSVYRERRRLLIDRADDDATPVAAPPARSAGARRCDAPAPAREVGVHLPAVALLAEPAPSVYRERRDLLRDRSDG